MQTIQTEAKPKRQFGGKTENFNSKEERNREKKHLKAYLKGQRYFFHGFIPRVTGREAARFPVLTKSN
jgi:hypothetical protein